MVIMMRNEFRMLQKMIQCFALQVGDNLSSASHVLGDLTPGTWYELAIEASSDAGIERVTLFADTHTLTGGKS